MFRGTGFGVELHVDRGEHRFFGGGGILSTGGGPAVFFKEAIDVVFTVKANIGGRLFDLDTEGNSQQH